MGGVGWGGGGGGSLECRDRERITCDHAAGRQRGEWGSSRQPAGRRSAPHPPARMPDHIPSFYTSMLTGCGTLDRARRRRRGGWRLIDHRSCSWRSEISDRPWATGPKANSGWQRFGRIVPRLPVCFGFNAAEALSCVDQVLKAKGGAHVFGYSAPFITRCQTDGHSRNQGGVPRWRRSGTQPTRTYHGRE